MRSANVAARAEVKIITMATLEAISRHPFQITRATRNMLMIVHAEIALPWSTTKGTRTGTFSSIAMHAMIPMMAKSILAYFDKSSDDLHTESGGNCHFNKLLPTYNEILLRQS